MYVLAKLQLMVSVLLHADCIAAMVLLQSGWPWMNTCRHVMFRILGHNVHGCFVWLCCSLRPRASKSSLRQ
jgi:DNA modification methylase